MTKKSFPTDRPMEGDSDAMVTAIAKLNEARIKFLRPSRYQLKIGDVNYYPGRGTIFVDGADSPEEGGGISEFIRQVKNRVNHKHDFNELNLKCF